IDRGNETLAYFLLLGLFPEFPYISILIATFLLVYRRECHLDLMIWMDSHLPNRPPCIYILFSHLSLIDLALISNTIQKMAINVFSGRKTSKVARGPQIFFFYVLKGGECLVLTMMSYDHYVAICNLLRVIMSPRICLLMTLVSYDRGTLNSLFNTIYTMNFPCSSRETHHFFCEMLVVLKLPCENISSGPIMSSYMLIFLTVLHGRRKAFTTTCFFHLAEVSLYWGSAMIIYMTDHSFHIKIFSVINTIFTPKPNPLIYTLRNKEVLAALRKLMGRGFILSRS
uniref:G-protein coupled receptors family 1 profile domain-containing protein n=1 Tax=Otolemur garnettii TaxID=30611 RepID=H0XMR4_OTOGA